MISIIIPIYNVAPYLRQCLDSVLTQTCTDWEAILIDDASTDNSAAIAAEYIQQDTRFTLLCQEINQGQSAARNKGLDKAKGEYIAFLDADDWWDKDYLEKHLQAIKGYDIVQSGYRRIQDNIIIHEKRPFHRWQFTSAGMRLYRSNAIKGLRFEEGTFYEDVLWTTDILLRHPHTYILRYIGYNYRINPNSTTAVPHKNMQKHVLDLLKHKRKSAIVCYTYIKLYLYYYLHKYIHRK